MESLKTSEAEMNWTIAEISVLAAPMSDRPPIAHRTSKLGEEVLLYS